MFRTKLIAAARIKRLSLFRLSYTFLRQYASKSFPDHEIINMPALSPTMTQGSLASWKKKVGEEISAGDVLAEVDTDKAQMDFEMQEDGYLAKILVEAGTQEVPVGSPIAVLVSDEGDVAAFSEFTIDDAGGMKSAPKPKVESPKESPKEKEPESKPASKKEEPKEKSQPISTSSKPNDENRIIASPAARKLASEIGVALKNLKGSGPNGRIVLSDVEAAAAASKQSSSNTVSTVSTYKDVPLAGMRKIIAKRLSESYSQSPHYFITIKPNVEKLLQLREALNERTTDRISVNDMLVKACSIALQRVPEVNSSWMGDSIREYTNVDISVAVATREGLITPIIKGVENLGLKEISSLTKDLSKRARENKLKPEEYQGGTFTISNLGMYDVESFTAIINPPQSCIIAVGTTRNEVIQTDSGFATTRTLKLTMSADHRIVDGAVGARFTQQLKKILEDPLEFYL